MSRRPISRISERRPAFCEALNAASPSESRYRRRTAISLFGSFTSNRQTASAIAPSTSVASTVPSHFLAGVERTT